MIAALIPTLAVGLAGGGLTLLVIKLLFFAAFCAIIWYGFTKIAIPEPIKTILLVVLLLIALAVLYQATLGAGFG